jgi:hypothetical protein
MCNALEAVATILLADDLIGSLFATSWSASCKAVAAALFGNLPRDVADVHCLQSLATAVAQLGCHDCHHVTM